MPVVGEKDRTQHDTLENFLPDIHITQITGGTVELWNPSGRDEIIQPANIIKRILIIKNAQHYFFK